LGLPGSFYVRRQNLRPHAIQSRPQSGRCTAQRRCDRRFEPCHSDQRRSSLRTARKWQSQMRLPFSHLCSVAPPFRIEPTALGFDSVFGCGEVRYEHSHHKGTLISIRSAYLFFFP